MGKRLRFYSVILLLLPLRLEATVPERFAILADRSGVVVDPTVQPKRKVIRSPWEPTAEDRSRGFAVAVIDTSDDLTPDWMWPEKVPLQRMNGFACRGQAKAVAFAVRTLQPIKGLSPIPEALRGPSGAVIPPENINVQMVQYVHQKDQSSAVWVGRWLQKPFPADLPANWTAWIWVTVDVPPEAAPGVYDGKIMFKEQAGREMDIPVRFRVLDFELKRQAGYWGMYSVGHFHGPDRGRYRNAAPPCWRPENLEAYFTFLKTRGMNSISLFHVYPGLACIDGHTVADFSDVQAFAQAMRAAGVDGDLCVDTRFIEWWANTASGRIAELRKSGGPIKGDLGIYGPHGEQSWTYDGEAKRLWAEAVKQLLAQADKEKWPPVRLLAEEEYGGNPSPHIKTAGYEAFMPELLKIAPDRAMAVNNAIGYGLKTIDRGARDHVKFREYNNWTPEGLEDARKNGAEVRSYNLGFARVPGAFISE